MPERARSPSYPNTPIQQAIAAVKRIHLAERTNAVDRGVAAKAMGYVGLTGRSATVLSDLSQYGLVERAGKSEVRVTPLAVEILHPDDLLTWEAALETAARHPDLFQKVAERFPDGRPSEAALESFLVKQGFTYTAIPYALRAYRETFSYLENAVVSDRNVNSAAVVSDSSSNQRVDEADAMTLPAVTGPTKGSPPPAVGKAPVVPVVTGPDVRLVNKQIHLGGILVNQAEADDLIITIKALRAMLKPSPVVMPAPDDEAPSLVGGALALPVTAP